MLDMVTREGVPVIDALALMAQEGGMGTFDAIQESLQNGRCLCALGDSAGFVIASTMKHFRSEYEEHCLEHRCSVEEQVVAASA